MSLALGLLSGLGKGMSDLADENMRRDAELQRDLRQNQFQTDRDARLESLAVQRAKAVEEIKNAPLIRLQAKAQEMAGQEVPQEAAPVTNLSGKGVSSIDGKPITGGFTGDPRKALAAANALPDSNPDKQGIIQQIRSQVAAEQAANQEAVAGKTRPRTADEAFESALEWAKTADLPAFAAGRGLASEKTVTVPDGATIIDKKGRVIFDNTASKAERENARQDRLDARQQLAEDARDQRQLNFLAAQEKLADIKNGVNSKGVSREERMRYTSLFTEAGRRMADVQKTINTLRQNPLYSMAAAGSREAQELDELKSQWKEFKSERDTYSALLAGSQDDAAPASTSDPLGLFKK